MLELWKYGFWGIGLGPHRQNILDMKDKKPINEQLPFKINIPLFQNDYSHHKYDFSSYHLNHVFILDTNE